MLVDDQSHHESRRVGRLLTGKWRRTCATVLPKLTHKRKALIGRGEEIDGPSARMKIVSPAFFTFVCGRGSAEDLKRRSSAECRSRSRTPGSNGADEGNDIADVIIRHLAAERRHQLGLAGQRAAGHIPIRYGVGTEALSRAFPRCSPQGWALRPNGDRFSRRLRGAFWGCTPVPSDCGSSARVFGAAPCDKGSRAR